VNNIFLTQLDGYTDTIIMIVIVGQKDLVYFGIYVSSTFVSSLRLKYEICLSLCFQQNMKN